MELFFIIGGAPSIQGQDSANLRHGLKRFERKILGVSAAAHKNLPTTVSAAHASRSAGEKKGGRKREQQKENFTCRNRKCFLFFTVLFCHALCSVFAYLLKLVNYFVENQY